MSIPYRTAKFISVNIFVMAIWTQLPNLIPANISGYMICTVGMVDGCGYDGQQKCTICYTCRLCHTILSQFLDEQICCTYNSLRYLDLQIC